MEFVHPEILWGLGALAIPIVIHLLQFRKYRRIRFSQVAFLQEVKRETRAVQQVRHWWILAMRLLAFGALITAFAQPYIPPSLADDGATRNTNMANGRVVGIYLDNSYSMEASGESGQLFQSALNKAAIVVEQFEATDRFQIISNDFSGRDQIFLTQGQALEQLEEIHPGPVARPIESVMKRMAAQLVKENNLERTAYLFSDLQASTHSFGKDALPPDTTIAWHFIPEYASATPNIWVDSIWFEEPMRIADRNAALRVRLRHNAHTKMIGIPMSLDVDGERVAIGSFQITPGMKTDTALRYTHGAAGLHRATVSIQDAPIRFDDQWHFGYESVAQIRILHVVNPEATAAISSVNRAFQSAKGLFQITTIERLTPESLQGIHLVVLNNLDPQSSGFAQTLENFVVGGGTLCILPQMANIDKNLLLKMGFGKGGSWTELNDPVSTWQTAHPFFKGVFRSEPARLNLPKVRAYWLRKTKPTEDVLAQTALGNPFLSRLAIGRGHVFFAAAGTEEEASNFTRHALWVPFMLRMAEQAYATPTHQGVIGLSKDFMVPLEPDQESEITLRWQPKIAGDSTRKSAPVFWPETRSSQGQTAVFIENLRTPVGHYEVHFDNRAVASAGINNNRRESDHTAFSLDEFDDVLRAKGWEHVDVIATSNAGLSGAIEQIERGRPLWMRFIAFAILALLFESLLLRRWKTQSS